MYGNKKRERYRSLFNSLHFSFEFLLTLLFDFRPLRKIGRGHLSDQLHPSLNDAQFLPRHHIYFLLLHQSFEEAVPVAHDDKRAFYQFFSLWS